MTKYERIVRAANRRVDTVANQVTVLGEKEVLISTDQDCRVDAIFLCADIRAALIADMCRIAGVKPPKKARKR